MSPSTSQQWDFETLSMLSQPAVIEEILEEPEKETCWRSTRQCFALACKPYRHSASSLQARHKAEDSPIHVILCGLEK